MLSRATVRGVSLVELLVALLLLEIAGVASLSAILTSHRLHRRMARASQIDAARWTAYRQAEVAASCADTSAGRAVALLLPAEAPRPAFPTTLACGK